MYPSNKCYLPIYNVVRHYELKLATSKFKKLEKVHYCKTTLTTSNYHIHSCKLHNAEV